MENLFFFTLAKEDSQHYQQLVHYEKKLRKSLWSFSIFKTKKAERHIFILVGIIIFTFS